MLLIDFFVLIIVVNHNVAVIHIAAPVSVHNLGSAPDFAVLVSGPQLGWNLGEKVVNVTRAYKGFDVWRLRPDGIQTVCVPVESTQGARDDGTVGTC